MSRIPIDDEDDDNNAEPGQQNPFAGQELEGEPAGDAETRGGGDVLDYERVKAERDSLYERLARAQAEFQNSRRRLQADQDQAVQYANASLIKSLLPVIDNFERALSVDPAKTDAAAILKGMQIVHDQWLNVLKQQQVEEVVPKEGEPFDPNRHEALMQQDNEKYRDQPAVLSVLQKGYALHGRVLRPAQVMVSKTS